MAGTGKRALEVTGTENCAACVAPMRSGTRVAQLGHISDSRRLHAESGAEYGGDSDLIRHNILLLY
jgi:hypothetical protein